MVTGGNRMINTQGMTPEKIRILSLELINRELGSDVMIEFLQQYSLGHGDYTKEREKLFEGETVESLFQKVLDFQESE